MGFPMPGIYILPKGVNLVNPLPQTPSKPSGNIQRTTDGVKCPLKFQTRLPFCPSMTSNYIVFLTLSAATYAIFSLGLNLQWGYTGLVNFGHVAFLTLGAYTTVLLSVKGVPLIIAALLGGVLAAFLGLLIGLSTLRLREDYLGIVTIGVSELVRMFIQNTGWLTGGVLGVQGYPILLNFTPTYVTKLFYIAVLTGVMGLAVWRMVKWLGRNPSQWWKAAYGIAGCAAIYISGASSLYNYDSRAGLMLAAVVVLAIVYVGLEQLTKSPWGRVLKAIREDEEVPKALGKNVFWYKLQALMLGGGIAGIAGAFYAWQITSVYPSNFEPLMTFNAWTIVVIGGAGNNVGAILGAVVFWAYDTITRMDWIKSLPIDADRVGAFRIMVIGFILMVIMLWRPQGLLGNRDELTLGK
jgi:neutral amino acid transport system permease protein